MPGDDLIDLISHQLVWGASGLAYLGFTIWCLARAERAPLAKSDGAPVLRYGDAMRWWFPTFIPVFGWLVYESIKQMVGPVDIACCILLIGVFAQTVARIFGYSVKVTETGLQFTVLFLVKPPIPWAQIAGADNDKGAARIDLKDGRELRAQRGLAGVSEFVEIVRARVAFRLRP